MLFPNLSLSSRNSGQSSEGTQEPSMSMILINYKIKTRWTFNIDKVDYCERY